MLMADNGWRRQNLLCDYHFSDDGQELTSAGQSRLQWIASQAPSNRRVVFVQQGPAPQLTSNRLDTVQTATALRPTAGQCRRSWNRTSIRRATPATTWTRRSRRPKRPGPTRGFRPRIRRPSATKRLAAFPDGAVRQTPAVLLLATCLPAPRTAGSSPCITVKSVQLPPVRHFDFRTAPCGDDHIRRRSIERPGAPAGPIHQAGFLPCKLDRRGWRASKDALHLVAWVAAARGGAGGCVSRTTTKNTLGPGPQGNKLLLLASAGRKPRPANRLQGRSDVAGQQGHAERPS